MRSNTVHPWPMAAALVLLTCWTAPAVAEDCNTNGLVDDDEVFGGTAADCDTDVVPDECEIAGGSPDCNGNLILDMCEISAGTVRDCNTNDVPDTCEIADGTLPDCNTNGAPDNCDLVIGEWDNGPFCCPFNALSNDEGATPSETIDGFWSDRGTTIVAATFTNVEESSYSWNGQVRAAVWELDGNAPAETALDEEIVSGISATRTQSGSLWNRPKYDYSLVLDLDVPEPGAYWFTGIPLSDETTGSAFWLASSVPAQFGQSYFRSDYYGFPTWTPTQNVVGQNWDFAFTLSFSPIPDCNTNGSPDECDIAGGSSNDQDGDGVPTECQFTCATCAGDLSGDAYTDGGDVSDFIACLFASGQAPPCGCADLNGDLSVNEEDLTLLISKLLNDATPCP